MITAASNGRLKRLIRLHQRAKSRREENVFLAEGVKMFLEAPPEKIREVYVAESFVPDDACGAKLSQIGCEVVADALFSRISDTCTPQGILCVVEQFHYNMEDLLSGPAPLLLILENIQDPGNLGTMLRTGEGAGIDGVIMSRDTVDLYNPKTIRSTMGSVYRVPFCYTGDLAGTIARIRKEKIRVYAAHLEGKQWYTQPDYREGAAFLIGNEGNGLREETARLADSYIKIPMEGQVESLNAGIASAILMYEAQRQRREL